jgi:hypothetical protein
VTPTRAPEPVHLPDPLPDPEEIERAPRPVDPNDDEDRRHRFERGPRPGKALRF